MCVIAVIALNIIVDHDFPARFDIGFSEQTRDRIIELIKIRKLPAYILLQITGLLAERRCICIKINERTVKKDFQPGLLQGKVCLVKTGTLLCARCTAHKAASRF